MGYRIAGKPKCKNCKTWLNNTNKAKGRTLCIYCAKKIDVERATLFKHNNPKPNALAYLMIIKCRYTGELYKANELTEGYDLVYNAPHGHLLPKKYESLQFIGDLMYE